MIDLFDGSTQMMSLTTETPRAQPAMGIRSTTFSKAEVAANHFGVTLNNFRVRETMEPYFNGVKVDNAHPNDLIAKKGLEKGAVIVSVAGKRTVDHSYALKMLEHCKKMKKESFEVRWYSEEDLNSYLKNRVRMYTGQLPLRSLNSGPASSGAGGGGGVALDHLMGNMLSFDNLLGG